MRHPTEAPLSLRILVKGQSSAVYVAPSGGGPSALHFPRLLELELRAHGLNATVRNTARRGQLANRALCTWDEDVERWAPDLVILNYGEYECLPAYLPFRLERHANSWHQHPGVLRKFYRRRLLKPAWRRLATLQQSLERRHGNTFRLSPARTIAELDRYLDQLRYASEPAVIVMGVWRPGDLWQEWFPRMSYRVEQMDSALRGLVSRTGRSNVRFLEVQPMVDSVAHDPLPDGIHFSAAVHERIAAALAGLVFEWLEGAESPRPVRLATKLRCEP